MSIYDRFKTKEELLAEIDSAIKQDGEEYVLDADNWQGKYDELKSRFDTEKNQHIKTRTGAKDAEKRLRELETALSAKETLVAELEKRTQDPETSKRASEYAIQIATLQKQVDDAGKELPELRDKVAKYEADAMEARVQTTLRETCKKLGIWDCAVSDILYRTRDFEFDDIGELVTRNSREPVSMVLAREMKEKPNWLPPSQGGNSNPGANLKNDPAAQKAAAEKLAQSGDFLASLQMLNGD